MLILSSCGGGAKADAEEICECWKEAETKGGNRTYDDCRKIEKEIMKKYKDDESGMEDLKEAMYEGCGASR